MREAAELARDGARAEGDQLSDIALVQRQGIDFDGLEAVAGGGIVTLHGRNRGLDGDCVTLAADFQQQVEPGILIDLQQDAFRGYRLEARLRRDHGVIAGRKLVNPIGTLRTGNRGACEAGCGVARGDANTGRDRGGLVANLAQQG